MRLRALASVHTESGANSLALTEASPVLLVFRRLLLGARFVGRRISDVAELSREAG